MTGVQTCALPISNRVNPTRRNPARFRDAKKPSGGDTNHRSLARTIDNGRRSRTPMLVHHKASTGHSNSAVNRFHLDDDSGQQVNSGGQDRPVQNHVLHFALGLDAIEGGIVVNHLFHALKPGLKAGVCRPIIANCAPTWLPSTKRPST